MTRRIGIWFGVPAVLTLMLVAIPAPAQAGTDPGGDDQLKVVFERVRVAAILVRIHPRLDVANAADRHHRRSVRFRGRARAEGNRRTLGVRFGELHSRRPRNGVAKIKLNGPLERNDEGLYVGAASASVEVGDHVEHFRLRVAARITRHDHRPNDAARHPHGHRLRLSGRFHSTNSDIDPSRTVKRPDVRPITVFRGVFRGGGRTVHERAAD